MDNSSYHRWRSPCFRHWL